MFADAQSLINNITPFVLPPERVTTLEAAEKYLMLKTGGGMAPWRRKKTPYMIEPMNCLTQRAYSSVIFMGPARSGKTEALLKAQVCHAVKCDPSDIMIVHMNQGESEYFSKTEIDPMLRASKDLRDCLSSVARDNNVSYIRLKAGNVIKLAHPVDATFRGKSFKYILLTDYDAIRPPSEGDVFTLSQMRTKSYQSSGMVLAESSPGLEVTDLSWTQKNKHHCPPAHGIASLYMGGDRRRFYWQCPECGEFFIPDFEHLFFDREETDPVKAAQHVAMGCPDCGGQIEEKQKNALNLSGLWLKEGEKADQNRIITGNGLKSTSASFWLPGPVAGFSKWGVDFVQKYIKAKNTIDRTGDDSSMQTFVNTDVGSPYVREREIEIDTDALNENIIDLKMGVAPKDTKFLLGTVDVQGGKHRRFVCQIVAIMNGKKQHIVDRFNITHFIDEKGNESPIRPDLYSEHWEMLNKRILDRWFKIESGGHVKPIMLGYDTNGEPGVYDRAREYYKANHLKYKGRLFPIKGASHKMETLVELRKPEPSKEQNKVRRRRKKVSNELPLYFLNTNKLKDIITANLQIKIGEDRCVTYPEDIDGSFFDELVSEERDGSGKWHQNGANESFDLCSYAWAILVYKNWVNFDNFDQDIFKLFIQDRVKTEGNLTDEKNVKPVKITKTTQRRRRRR